MRLTVQVDDSGIDTCKFRPNGRPTKVSTLFSVTLVGDRIRRSFVQKSGGGYGMFRVESFDVLEDGSVRAWAVRITSEGKVFQSGEGVLMRDPIDYGPVIFELFQEAIELAKTDLRTRDWSEAVTMHKAWTVARATEPLERGDKVRIKMHGLGHETRYVVQPCDRGAQRVILSRFSDLSGLNPAYNRMAVVKIK